MPERNCPLCETDNRQETPHHLSTGPWRLKSCRSCSLVYLENPPDYSALEDEFAWEKSFQAENDRRAKREPVRYRLVRQGTRWLGWTGRTRHKLPRLVDEFVAAGRILDIGCGDGKWLARLGETFDPYGIEISPGLVARARANLESRSGRIVQADAMTGLAHFPDGHFDGALMHAYLEHEMRPRQVLEETWRVLRPGGHLIVKVPNFASLLRRIRGSYWCGLRFPDHVTYFSPATLSELLARCGFEMARFHVRDRLPTSDNMWCVAVRQSAVIPFAQARDAALLRRQAA